jgi:hypothetical protein
MGAALQGYLTFPVEAPVQFVALQNLLLNVVVLPSVNTDFLAITKSFLRYKDLLSDLPLPRIQLKLPALPWGLICQRLATPLPSVVVDLNFQVLNDLLPNRELALSSTCLLLSSLCCIGSSLSQDWQITNQSLLSTWLGLGSLAVWKPR